MTGVPQANRLTARAALGVVTLHAAAVLWLTWPLATHVATHFPDPVFICRFDTRLVAFVLAHQSRAFASAPGTLADLGVYHPSPHTLFYGEAAFGALPYFMPTFLATGNPTLALNLTLLVSLALTAAALHLVVLRWTGSHAGGAIAGLIFLATRWVHWTWVPAAPNYAVMQYLPFVILLAAERTPRRRALFGLLALVVLQGLSSVYLAAATVAPLLLLGLVRTVRPATRRAGIGLLLVLAAALVLLLGFYSGYLVVRSENPELPAQTLWRQRAFEGRMVLPADLVDPKTPTSVPPVAFALILAGVASLVLGGWRRIDQRTRQGWRHAMFWTVVGLWIALTPVVELRLGTLVGSVTLPQTILAQWTPIYDVVREPHRLAVAALFGLALLAGLSVAEAARRLAARLPAAVARGVAAVGVVALAAVMYGEIWRGSQFAATGPRPRAYPLLAASDVNSSPLMPILQRPGGPLLEVGVPASTGDVRDEALNAEAMYRAIFHHRRLVNGYSGYWPASFGERFALIEQLPDRAALRALRERTDLDLILVHDRTETPEFRRACEAVARAKLDFPACHPETIERMHGGWAAAAAGRRDDLRLVARDGSDLLFAVVDGARPQ